MEKSSSRIIFFIASLFFLFLFLFVFVFKSTAGTITILSAPTLSNSSINAENVSYTVQFTPQTAVSAGGNVQVKFIFPQGVTFGLAGITRDSSTSAQLLAITNASQAQSSQTVIFSTSGLSASTEYTIKINGVINPGNPGMGVVAVATHDGTNYIDGNIQSDPPSKLSPSFQIGTAAFKGKVTNPSGVPVNNAWVNIFPVVMTGSMPQGSSTNYNGDYLIPTTNITNGASYKFEVFPPFEGGSNLISPTVPPQTYSGSAVTVNLQFQQATKTITGTVKYSNNNAVVANATVNSFKMNGSGYAQTTTNSSGVYTLTVGGGSWGVMPQAQSGNDWSYGDKPQDVKFADDTTTQSQTVNFTVDRATATITGRILKPNGDPVNGSTDQIGVGVFSQEGKGGGGQVGSNGTFSIAVPAGTYNFNVWAPPSSDYGTPAVPSVTVKDNETKALGDITLATKDATITGSVKVEGTGTGVSGVSVNAFVRDGGGFSMAMTDGSGNFSMKVTAGRWMIMPFFDSSASYAMNDPPQEVSVSAGGTTSVNFTVKSASSTISGTIIDGSGNAISTVYGWSYAETSGGGMFGPGGLGGPIERGSFSFKVPAGSYTVKAGLAPGSGYTPGDGTAVTVADGATANVSIALKSNDAVITGSIIDDNGNAITDSNIFIFAVSGASEGHSFQQGTVSGSTYTINVSSGEWSLGYFVDPSSGYMSAPPDPSLKFSISSGGTETKNITLKSANSTISGTVTKPDGTAATGVFVSIDNRETEGKEFFNGSPTDTNGSYTVKITNGTYKVRVNVAPNSGFLSPAEQNITVAANETKTANFTLRQSDGTISGTITLNGSGVQAFVSAWAEDGSFAQSMSSSTGAYSLSVSKGTIWHVGAHYESGITPYESSETTVNMTGSTATANLTLSQATYNLPQALTMTFDSTKPKIITLTDGTEINIPASALATSGNVTLTINPKASLPTKKGDKPLWYGYEFSATDSNGQTISQFNSSITITFPYSDAQLTKLGITAGDLVSSYWDETSGTWKKVSNVTVNTTSHTITITVDHFTDFALTANATTASSTSTSSSSGGTSSSSSSTPAKFPELYADQGAVFKREQAIVIVEEKTSPWDAYLSVEIPSGKLYRFGAYTQISDVYNLWLRSFFNNAKIVNPKKPSIVALHYDLKQLKGYSEGSLKLAYSSNEGKSWKVLPTSVLDRKNKTVAALSKLGGYYMIVAGYGNYTVDYGTTKAEITPQPINSPEPKTVEKQKVTNNTETMPPKQTLLQKILNFLLRK